MFLVGIASIVLIAGGVAYWLFYTTPEYSLHQIEESVKNRDITSFEKYVDIEGITMRMLADIPEVIGKNTRLGFFSDDVNQMVFSVLQEPIAGMVKEAVRSYIERGRLNSKMTEKRALADFLKQLPVNSFKHPRLKTVNTEGKICKVLVEVVVEAFEGRANIEFLMRDKGSYWQIAEFSNLYAIMEQLAELKRSFPYRNRYAAAIWQPILYPRIVRGNRRAFRSLLRPAFCCRRTQKTDRLRHRVSQAPYFDQCCR